MPKWEDEAIVIKIKKQGEKSFILIALTKNHGKHLGWFNYRSKKISMFNLVIWLNLHGLQDFLSTELFLQNCDSIVGKIIEDELKLSMLSSFCSLLNFFIPEELCTIL